MSDGSVAHHRERARADLELTLSRGHEWTIQLESAPLGDDLARDASLTRVAQEAERLAPGVDATYTLAEGRVVMSVTLDAPGPVEAMSAGAAVFEQALARVVWPRFVPRLLERCSVAPPDAP